jgi:hypothetical protein
MPYALCLEALSHAPFPRTRIPVGFHSDSSARRSETDLSAGIVADLTGESLMKPRGSGTNPAKRDRLGVKTVFACVFFFQILALIFSHCGNFFHIFLACAKNFLYS